MRHAADQPLPLFATTLIGGKLAMRPNAMRAGVERGELQIGTWVNMARNPAILQLLKSAGLDFARVDIEHSSPSMETIADFALVARAIDFPIAVRPPKANREWIIRLLDVGVWNLHCPQVETANQAGENRRRLSLCADGAAGERRLYPCHGIRTPGSVQRSAAPSPTARSS